MTAATSVTDVQLLTIAAMLVATLFGVLAAVIAWIGTRAIGQLEALGVKLDEVSADLHNRVTSIEGRLIRVETVQELHEGVCDVTNSSRAR